MTLLWWHWMAFGLLLVAAELLVPSFTIVWFGLGACVTGLLLLAAPTAPVALQLLVWAVSSTAATVAWFNYFRPKMADRTKAGMSREAIVGTWDSGDHEEKPEFYRATVIAFQNGPIKEEGYNGLSQEALFAVIIDRLEGFQSGKFACRENAVALTHTETALLWLAKRTMDRLARSVEGTSQQ